MISVKDALTQLFALVDVMPIEIVPLRAAAGRVCAQDIHALRDQPPFASSAMDGYAISAADYRRDQVLLVVGTSAAGHGWQGQIKQGQAVRIFTGAPVPDGADRIVIQEDVTRSADQITLTTADDPANYIRPLGADFKSGTIGPRQGQILRPSDIALLAAMNIAQLPVFRKPVVAVIATGDELVQPGEAPRADQIVASNSYALAALITQTGGTARLLPIARDTTAALKQAFDLAKDADLIVTTGGASVGDHDLVGQVAQAHGLDRAFYKVAMRPGKPLMAGRMGAAAMIGLPGNPVSALVCGYVFLVPVIRKMLGLGASPIQESSAPLAAAITANGPREHYMRAHLGPRGVTVFDRQDSSLLSVMAQANCLAIRPINDPPRAAGDFINYIALP
jgi:molybdopterin molybdotransferase